MKIKEIIAKTRIPKNTSYCYTPKGPLKNGMGYRVKSCPYFKWKHCKEYGDKMEYCTYLKDWLFVQDMVKDCGINDYEFKEE